MQAVTRLRFLTGKVLGGILRVGVAVAYPVKTVVLGVISRSSRENPAPRCMPRTPKRAVFRWTDSLKYVPEGQNPGQSIDRPDSGASEGGC